MRVLLVTHDYLPRHPSGTEIYTAGISARLRARGLEVELFTTEKDITRPHLALDERAWEGMRVHELVNNLFYENFRETWDWPAAVEAFGRVLDRFRPDVIHVMHLLYLSIGCVEEAHRRGIPVVYTLHDFWLTCARFGQLIHADGSVCHTVDFERCGTCLARLKYAQTPLERKTARVIAGVRSVSGINLESAARGAASLLSTSKSDSIDEPGPEVEAEFAALARERTDEMLGRLVPHVRRFFSPSRFLRDRFIAWGIPEGRIEHVPNGIDVDAFAGFRREPAADGKLRVAFLGTLAPHKAPHLILEAWGRLDAGLESRARLTLYGPKHHFPEYVARLEARAAEVGASLPGALARDAVPAAWRTIDLLVVPSTWYENAPLTLLEARLTRTPVLVTDLGGMAELVQNERHGWRFPAGDVSALANHLARIIADRQSLETLDFGDEEVWSIDDCAQAMIDRYERVREVNA